MNVKAVILQQDSAASFYGDFRSHALRVKAPLMAEHY